MALNSLQGKCVFSSEIDQNARYVYHKNFAEMPSGDITTIHERDIPEHDVLCAGFPCQAFSVSGKRLGFKDTRGTLFFEIARIAKSKRPKIIFLENVKHFISHNQGKTFAIVKKTLEDLNYIVFYQVLRSTDFGVPQSRERIYMVAIRDDLNISQFRFPDKQIKCKTIKEILIPLSQREIKKLIIDRNDIEFYRDEKDLTKIYRPFQIGKINKGGQGERIYSIHAQGVTLSAHGGGAAAKTGAYLINGKVRRLHPKECLRMQGFPDNFKLIDNFNISYKQLGNSVSVPVIKEIFKEILKLSIF